MGKRLFFLSLAIVVVACATSPAPESSDHSDRTDRDPQATDQKTHVGHPAPIRCTKPMIPPLPSLSVRDQKKSFSFLFTVPTASIHRNEFYRLLVDATGSICTNDPNNKGNFPCSQWVDNSTTYLAINIQDGMDVAIDTVPTAAYIHDLCLPNHAPFNPGKVHLNQSGKDVYSAMVSVTIDSAAQHKTTQQALAALQDLDKHTLYVKVRPMPPETVLSAKSQQVYLDIWVGNPYSRGGGVRSPLASGPAQRCLSELCGLQNTPN